MATYRMQSVKTQYYPVTDGAKDGAILATKNGASVVPPNTTLTFSAPVKDKPVIVTIAGPDGLYITLPDGAVDGTKLTWTTTAYEWTVNPTVASDNSITYQFSPADGQNFYMFDEFGIGPVIIAKSGATIVPPQSFFSLTMA
ncbi:hypothetical protein GALMADRAFT_208943 [Galerina marginata CBS 339.88]|uniref:Uncharacterized protein n=1 Tax=Galerina marginata (strain CBS 339.88) TaxID=685588 RepID=A0A067TL02_GALM3|nr:hypothetical protein GALMADRAFT_208943 [Galerina marginata CBS 339.88]